MEKREIVYVFDILCVWGYGFLPVLKQIIAEYNEYFNFQTVNGGLHIRNKRMKAKDKLPDDYKNVYQNIKKITGADVTDHYLDDLIQKRDLYLDSEIAAIGINVFKSYRSDIESRLDFIYYLQDKLFREGKDPNTDEFYETAASHFSISPQEFISKMKEKKYEEEAFRDFTFTRKVLKTQAFPSLYLKHSDQEYELLMEGYKHLKTLDKKFKKITDRQTEDNTT